MARTKFPAEVLTPEGEVFKDDVRGFLLRRVAVDRLHLHEGEILLSLDRKPDRSLHDESGP